MKARFIGDPNDGFGGPDVLTTYGVEFVKGDWTDLPADLSKAARDKLAHNSHFEVKVDPLDHDGNGRKGGSVRAVKEGEGA